MEKKNTCKPKKTKMTSNFHSALLRDISLMFNNADDYDVVMKTSNFVHI